MKAPLLHTFYISSKVSTSTIIIHNSYYALQACYFQEILHVNAAIFNLTQQTIHINFSKCVKVYSHIVNDTLCQFGWQERKFCMVKGQLTRFLKTTPFLTTRTITIIAYMVECECIILVTISEPYLPLFNLNEHMKLFRKMKGYV